MESSKKNYLILSGLLLFFVYSYAATMPSAFDNNDSPETALASYTLGISHPPAYPLFTLLGKTACIIGLGGPAFHASTLSVVLAFFTLFFIFVLASGARIKTGDNFYTGIFAVLLAGVSSLFWSQATDAKGGIYMLNLLFTASCGILAIKIIRENSIKYMYLLAFVYGLSLSNHWPSMGVLFPVFIAPFIIQRKSIKKGTGAIMCLLFLLGLTPYIYLSIRTGAMPILNIGQPGALKNFVWVVLRQGYDVLPFSFDLLLWQAKEYFKIVVSNYEAFWIIALAGGFMMYKKDKPWFSILAGIFVCNSFAVVFLNRNPIENPEIMKLFLLPSQMAVAAFAAFGVTSFFATPGKLKNIAFAVFCVVFLLILGAFSYMENSSQRNFAAYDYGKNILKTQGAKAIYVGEGAPALMPVYYAKYVLDNKGAQEIVALNFLYFDWGIAEFNKKYGSTKMAPTKQGENFEEVLEKLKDREVLLGTLQPELNKLAVARGYEKQNGILWERGERENAVTLPFYLYSYRGVAGEYLEQKKTSSEIGMTYSKALLSCAKTMLTTGRYAEAVNLYTFALAFSNIGDIAAIEMDLEKAKKLSTKNKF
ncbi:MAG: DUF2723 domain-containing protein [bacterium]